MLIQTVPTEIRGNDGICLPHRSLLLSSHILYIIVGVWKRVLVLTVDK